MVRRGQGIKASSKAKHELVFGFHGGHRFVQDYSVIVVHRGLCSTAHEFFCRYSWGFRTSPYERGQGESEWKKKGSAWFRRDLNCCRDCDDPVPSELVENVRSHKTPAVNSSKRWLVANPRE